MFADCIWFGTSGLISESRNLASRCPVDVITAAFTNVTEQYRRQKVQTMSVCSVDK